MIFVNLPVADVEKSVAFYEAIGFIKDERFSQPGSAGAMVWSDTIVFMILSHAHFADFTSKRIVDAKSEVEALLCLSLDSRQGVDAIVEKAVLAGGKADPGPKQDYGTYLDGDAFTAGDLMMTSVLRSLDGKDLIERHPNLVAYKARCQGAAGLQGSPRRAACRF
jgi:hypothetical protein